MATISEIIQDALVDLGIYDPDESVSGAEAERGLRVVQAFYDSLWNSGMFGRMTDIIAEASGEAEEFQRIQVGAYTITLPTEIDDAVSDETRPPIDLCPIELVTAGQEPAKHLYDGTRGEWVALNGLSLTDDAPLAGRGQHGLTCCIAMRLAGARAGIPQVTQIEARKFLSMLSTKRGSDARAPEATYY